MGKGTFPQLFLIHSSHRNIMTLSDEERKARKNAWQKKNRQKPEVRAKENEKNKIRMRKYNKKPEVITRRRKYDASPERKANVKAWNSKPETKVRRRNRHATYSEKAKVIIARGKRECACCGNKNFKWLQIDHIIPQRNSKNKEDLKTLLREIVQVKRPDSEFQLLCANCNFAKSDLKACPIDHSRD